MPGTFRPYALHSPPCHPVQVTVHRRALHSAPGMLPLTFYPRMPGNSTARPGEKWGWQRPRMAARMGRGAADACFQGACRRAGAGAQGRRGAQ